MFGFRILIFLVAYLVVLAEMIAGTGATKAAQGYVWISVGAVVITLLLSLSNFVLPSMYGGGDQQRFPKLSEWFIMGLAGVFIAGTSFYFDPHIKGLMLN